LFCLSCKKDTAGSNTNFSKVSSISNYSNGAIISSRNFLYDSNGRIIKETDISTLQSSYTTYHYSGSTKTAKTFNNNDTTISIMTLNSNGLVISSNMGAMNFTFEYNIDNYLIKVFQNLQDRLDTITYNIVNGIIVTETMSLLAETIKSNFTNYTNTIGNENFGESFLGKQSINLVSGIIFVGSDTTTYNYHFDKKNRVSRQTIVSDINNSTIYKYTD